MLLWHISPPVVDLCLPQHCPPCGGGHCVGLGDPAFGGGRAVGRRRRGRRGALGGGGAARRAAAHCGRGPHAAAVARGIFLDGGGVHRVGALEVAAAGRRTSRSRRSRRGGGAAVVVVESGSGRGGT